MNRALAPLEALQWCISASLVLDRYNAWWTRRAGTPAHCPGQVVAEAPEHVRAGLRELTSDMLVTEIFGLCTSESAYVRTDWQRDLRLKFDRDVLHIDAREFRQKWSAQC